jgi:hypothetical protein
MRELFAARRIAFCFAILGLSIGSVQCAWAQSARPAAENAQIVRNFLQDTAQLLRQNPVGGGNMVAQIRDLAVADPTTLQPILNMLANATKEQKSAIGSGLAQAARIVVRTNQAYATEIQESIAKTKDQDVVLAYAATAGDQPIGAVGGAAAGGGASGGQTAALNGGFRGGGGLENIGSGGVNTGQFSISSSVSGISGTTGNTVTSAAVSP